MRIVAASKIEDVNSDTINLDAIEPVDIQVVANDMIRFAIARNGVGLSACQVGDFRKLFVWNQGRWTQQDLVNYRQEQSRLSRPDPLWKKVNSSGPSYIWKVVINPMYVGLKGGDVTTAESCLSYKDRVFIVKRWNKVWVNYWTIEDNKFVKKKRRLSGYASVIFQHETDHTNGITIKMIGEEHKHEKPVATKKEEREEENAVDED